MVKCTLEKLCTRKEKTVETAYPPHRNLEVRFVNGVTGYAFECPDGHWEIRYCDRPCRGEVTQDFALCNRSYSSATDAMQAVAEHYNTKVWFRCFR